MPEERVVMQQINLRVPARDKLELIEKANLMNVSLKELCEDCIYYHILGRPRRKAAKRGKNWA